MPFSYGKKNLKKIIAINKGNMAAVVVPKGPTLGIRHVQALLLFFCFIMNFMQRLVVSVTLVAMTNAATTNPDFPEYDWDSSQMSYIISSVFWGFTIMQLPGSYLCRNYGARLIMTISLLGSSVLGIITPFCIPFGGWSIYCGIRTCQGLFQGLFFPIVHDHLAKWCPIKERTRIGALVTSGQIVGMMFALVVPGVIAKSSLGWPGISYVAGGLGLLVCVFWIAFAENTPATSKFISIEERNYILASQQTNNGSITKIPIPWKAMLGSRPFFSLVVVLMAETWGHTTILAEMPLYLRGVMDMKIMKNALFSSLPYLASFAMSFVYVIAADIILIKNILSLTALRKVINTIAMWTPAVTLVVVGFLDENQKTLAVVLMIVTVGANAGVTVGHYLNGIDLSPNHASTMAGITFTLASLVAVITPLFVGVVVTDQTDRSQWQIVFLTSSLIYFLGNLQYLFFGTTETQPWNDQNFLKEHDDSEKQREIKSNDS